jgi:hypothetical protein
MVSDRAIRVSTFLFGIVFAVIVALGYLPGINAPVHQHHAGSEPGEHMLLGLYTISLLDDVTHGLTALVLLFAAAKSARACRAALTFFGCYYAMDAIIYLVTGILRGDPLASNIKLNLPHVVFSTVMLTLAWRGRTNAPKVRVAVA